jgi:hypothetical protein
MPNLQKEEVIIKISLYFFNFKNMQSKLKARKSHLNPILLIGEGIKQNSCPLRMRGKASKGKFGLCHSDELPLPQ